MAILCCVAQKAASAAQICIFDFHHLQFFSFTLHLHLDLFLGLSDPLVKSRDPAPDPTIIKQK
jgi:hypothetical protein